MIIVGTVREEHWGSYICVIQKRAVGDCHTMIIVGTVREERCRSYIFVIQKGAVGDSHTMIIVGTVREEHWGSYICVIQNSGADFWQNRGFNDKSVKTSKIVALDLLIKIGYGPIV